MNIVDFRSEVDDAVDAGSGGGHVVHFWSNSKFWRRFGASWR